MQGITNKLLIICILINKHYICCMKTIKQLTKKLDKFGDKTWRSRCAEDIGCSYQTVLNATNGTYSNFKVRKWISDEIEKMNQMFI